MCEESLSVRFLKYGKAGKFPLSSERKDLEKVVNCVRIRVILPIGSIKGRNQFFKLLPSTPVFIISPVRMMPQVFLRSAVLIALFSVLSTQNAMSSGPILLNQESFVAQIGNSLNSSDGYELEVDIFVPEDAAPAGSPLFASLTTSLNGNGFAVRNLKGPMFQEISGGEVSDLNLETHNDGALGNGILAVGVTNSIIENVTLSGTLVSSGNSTGGLAGHIQETTVEQVNSTVNISGSHNGIGGIVGSSQNSTINLVKVEATISGSNNVGGIAGVVDSTTISNSQFKGSIEADSNNAGGIAGVISEGTQINSSNSEGSVEGNSQVGGLVGSSTGAANNLLVSSYS